MNPRNLTLPLSEHPLSSILVLDLSLSVVCNAFSFSACTILARSIHMGGNTHGREKVAGNAVVIGKSEVDDNS